MKFTSRTHTRPNENLGFTHVNSVSIEKFVV